MSLVQTKGGERLLYGYDDCVGQHDLIVVEGEMDKLALEEAGFINVVRPCSLCMRHIMHTCFLSSCRKKVHVRAMLRPSAMQTPNYNARVRLRLT